MPSGSHHSRFVMYLHQPRVLDGQLHAVDVPDAYIFGLPPFNPFYDLLYGGLQSEKTYRNG